MSRIRFAQEKGADSLQQTIIERMKTGKVVPIISKVISGELVLGQAEYEKLVEAYARYVDYKPAAVDGPLQLSQITQYVSVVRELVPDRVAAKEFFLKFAKSWLFELAETGGLPPEVGAELEEEFDTLSFTKLAERLGYPRFNQGADDPLLVLASFPLPIYLTTCYHYFIEIALTRAGKEPRTAICPWREGLEARPFFIDQAGQPVFDETHRPNQAQPLVYHLHGFDEYPASLVLTEDDYLEFLLAISQHKGQNTDLIPGRIREVLVESSLLLLGFRLRGWDFRALFWGLIKSSDVKRRYRSVCVQLDPDEVDEKYLQSYLSEADFGVYRGNIYQYARELRQGLEV